MQNEGIDSAELVELHSDYLLSFAIAKLGDIELSKDLVQDTFISAITKLDTFEGRSNIRTWLTSILNRKIIDYWRKAETRFSDPVSSFFDQNRRNHHWYDTQMNVSDLSTIESKIINNETYQELYDCIDSLPIQWKGILSAKYLAESPSDEICKEFSITPSNLWVIVHRAKLLLRDCLKSKN